MLVLSRKEDESVRLDDTIEIVVVEIRGDKVRLGFKAPDSVKIYRQEVYEQMKALEVKDGNGR